MRVRRAVFLDRDNTLNVDHGYTFRVADWQFLPHVPEALKMLADAGFLLIVISNQSGIGRGYYTEADLLRLQDHVNGRLGGMISAWYHCPHLPEAKCQCRKPQPGMILQAAAEWHIDLPTSWMVGDKLSDALAGLAAGTRAGLIRPGGGNLEEWPEVGVWPDLLTAAREITGREQGPEPVGTPGIQV